MFNCSQNICYLIGATLVTLMDMVLGSLIIYFSSFPIREFEELRTMFYDMDLKDDVALWGVSVIPVFAIIGIFIGIRQIWSICIKTVETPQAWKFFAFIISEVACFALPFYFISDYETKVNYVLEFSEQHDLMFIVFKLLLLNEITIGLFMYQIFSFLVVYRYNWINHQRGTECEVFDEEQSSDLKSMSWTRGTGGSCNTKATNVLTNTIGHQDVKLDDLMEELPKLPPDYSTTVRPSRSRSRSHSVVEIDDTKPDCQIRTADRRLLAVYKAPDAMINGFPNQIEIKEIQRICRETLANQQNDLKQFLEEKFEVLNSQLAAKEGRTPRHFDTTKADHLSNAEITLSPDFFEELSKKSC